MARRLREHFAISCARGHDQIAPNWSPTAGRTARATPLIRPFRGVPDLGAQYLQAVRVPDFPTLSTLREPDGARMRAKGAIAVTQHPF